MGTKWSDALARVATAIRRRQSPAGGEVPELADELGFTLIELMVVLVIMGILMAIAIPTFLGVTSTANDTSTQSNLANVITSAKAIYAKTDSYPVTATMAKDLQKDEPEFKFTTSAGTAALATSTKQDTIAVLTGATTGTTFIAVAYMTKTDECWVAKTTQSGVKYGFVKPTTNTEVTATKCKPTTATATITWSTGSGWPGAPAGH